MEHHIKLISRGVNIKGTILKIDPRAFAHGHNIVFTKDLLVHLMQIVVYLRSVGVVIYNRVLKLFVLRIWVSIGFGYK